MWKGWGKRDLMFAHPSEPSNSSRKDIDRTNHDVMPKHVPTLDQREEEQHVDPLLCAKARRSTREKAATHEQASLMSIRLRFCWQVESFGHWHRIGAVHACICVQKVRIWLQICFTLGARFGAANSRPCLAWRKARQRRVRLLSSRKRTK